jgi:hypothetical protein
VADEKKKGGSLLLTAVLGLAGALIPTLVIMLLVRTCDDPAQQRRYKYQREQRAQKKAEPEESIRTDQIEETVIDTVVAEVEDKFLTLEEGLLALAPGVYISVRFLHESGTALTPDELLESEGVHTVEITVRSAAWDEMKPDDRVVLLNDTFKFIKDRFPNMTKFLCLTYDDGRPAFDMKFGDEI